MVLSVREDMMNDTDRRESGCNDAAATSSVEFAIFACICLFDEQCLLNKPRLDQ